MLRSFTTTTSSQVIREKVRGVQNFKILVGTTGRRPWAAAAARPYAARVPSDRRHAAAVRSPRTAVMPPFATRAPPSRRRSPPADRRTAAVRRPRTAITGRNCHPTCLNSRRPAAKDRICQCRRYVRRRWRGVVTRGDGRSRHFGTAVAVQAVQCRALSAVPRRRRPAAAWHKITALNAAQLLVQVGASNFCQRKNFQ